MSVVVEGASADEVAIDHAGFIDEDATTDFEIELALGYGGHFAALHAAGVGGDLHTVADTGDGLVVFEEVSRDANEVFVVADVLRSATTGEEDPEVIIRIDIGERDIGLDGIAFPFFGDGPAWFNLVHHHLVAASFGSRHRGDKTGFLKPVVGVHRIERFARIADDDQHAMWHVNAC